MCLPVPRAALHRTSGRLRLNLPGKHETNPFFCRLEINFYNFNAFLRQFQNRHPVLMMNIEIETEQDDVEEQTIVEVLTLLNRIFSRSSFMSLPDRSGSWRSSLAYMDCKHDPPYVQLISMPTLTHLSNTSSHPSGPNFPN